MQSRINSRLNLIIPVDGTARGTIYIHTTPLSREVFEQHFKAVALSHTNIFKQGFGVHTGPRIASLLLKEAADELGVLDAVERGLLPEIHRLTNVLALEEGRGYVAFPYHEAVEWMDEDDRAEVENAIVFFILSSAVFRRVDLASFLNLANSLWGALTTSSNCTEYAASLTTSMREEATRRAVEEREAAALGKAAE